MPNILAYISEMGNPPMAVYMNDMPLNEDIQNCSEGGFTRLHKDSIMEIVSRLSLLETYSLLGLLGKRIDNILKKRIENCRHIETNLHRFPNFKPEHLFDIGRHLYTLNICPKNDTMNKALNVLSPIMQGAATTANLHSLVLNNIKFSRAFAHALRNVIFHLTSLDLSYCNLIDEYLIRLLPNALNLRTLKILGNEILNGNFINVLPKNEAGEFVLNQLEIQHKPDWGFSPSILTQEQKHLKIIVYLVPFTAGTLAYSYNRGIKKLIYVL